MNITAVAVWMFVLACLTAIAGLCIALRREPAESRFRGRKRLWYLGYVGACLKRWIMRQVHADRAEEQYFREMYVNERPGAKRMEGDCLF